MKRFRISQAKLADLETLGYLCHSIVAQAKEHGFQEEEMEALHLYLTKAYKLFDKKEEK